MTTPLRRAPLSRPTSPHPAAALAVVLLLAATVAPPRARATPRADPGPERAVTSTAHFRFYSSFWLNAHSFLHMEGKRSAGIDDASLGGRGNVAFDTLRARPASADEERRWKGAVDHYRADVVAAPMRDSIVIRVNNRLALAGDTAGLESVELPAGTRRVLLDAGAVYRALWWPAHDRRNRAWIAVQRQYLARYEEHLARRLSAVLGSPWPADPVRVDASVYASWFGAYTTERPPHITISSSAVGSQGSWGLEGLVHEAGHLMLAPVDSAIAAAARRQGRPVPDQLAHLILFYTAGELVREVLPEHVPYADEFRIWRRNGAARRYRALLRQEWQPYLEGGRDLDVAIDRLVRRAP